ncbi:MAG: sigma-70 family RNA polymerase sigma factor [Bacteroidales bacterium]|nr:sigma-70 family RNA polymerase sigma factor [Bacteroidales bacterium]
MWPTHADTDRLLDDARDGKPGAVDALLGQYREPLRHIVDLRLDPVLARRVDASDIVQDVLLEANQRLTEYLKSPDMPFHLWLRHLAQDRIIDTHRRHRLAQRRSIDREQPIHRPAWLDDGSSVSLVAQLVDQDRTPASEAIQEELTRRLHAAISSLSEDDRDIILMRHTEQLSNQEVAVLLGLTEAAASMRYLRALRRLRVVLLPQESTDNAKEPT